MYEANSGLFSDLSAAESTPEEKTAAQIVADRDAAVAETSNTNTAEQRQSQLFSG